MTVDPLSLSAWPGGQDNYHGPSHAVFQVGGELPGRLVEAINVDIDDAGRVRPRAGHTGRFSPFVGQIRAAYGCPAGLWVQQDTGFILIDPSNWSFTIPFPPITVEGIAKFLSHAGQIWWTDGLTCGRIEDCTPKTWGAAPAPPPTLTATGGNLPPGRYLVACTYTDANDVEHGAQKAALITLTRTGGISVDISSPATEAVTVNVYMSSTNQKGLFWAKEVAVAGLPTTVSNLSEEVRQSVRPCRGLGCRGPIPGDGLFSYLGMIFIYRDNLLFRSNGVFHHLFYVRQHVTAFPNNILGGVGLKDGFWITTAYGAWFVTGTYDAEADAFAWNPIKKDQRKYAARGKLADGTWFPTLETSEQIALFVSEDGLMAGLTTGQIVPLTPDQMVLDVANQTASIVLRKVVIDGQTIRQCLFTLYDPRSATTNDGLLSSASTLLSG